ncbi:MAG: succinylglutamate desuccinylase/aspartoacylase family protein [Lachnospiraceae bacterium]|nr:succinylglutamate desuccinylase/aspartoacylase family protein [Lachnospiraceae bacterium]
MLRPYDLPFELPVTLICGRRQGMTLLVTTQIHAGEYNGSAASMLLARDIDPERLAGNLIIFHCVNLTGFWQRKRRFVPEDRANLNANFPGDRHGTTGHQIARWFVEHIFPQVEFITDLHGGKDNDLLEPCIFYPRAKSVTEMALSAAKKMNVPYLLASSNATGLYGYAANEMNIPGFIIERGYGCVQRPEWIEGHRDGVRLLMDHFRMYELEREIPHPEPKVYERSAYITFSERGVWHPTMTPGQPFEKGALLGYTSDFFGNVINRYEAEHAGTPIYFNAGLCVLEGDEAIAYGIDE